MLGRFISAKTFMPSSQESTAVRNLRAQLCGPSACALAEALVRAAARERDAQALVALVHERLVELSRPELLRLADAVHDHDPSAAATLRTLAGQSTRLQPTAQRLGDTLAAVWLDGAVGGRDIYARGFVGGKKHASQEALVARALKSQRLGALVFAGCRLPPNGVRIGEDEAPGTATALRLYRSLLLFPNLLAQLPFVAFYARTKHTGAALIGASLQHGDVAWRTRLLDLLADVPDPELVSALLPHGDILRTLSGLKVRWIDWLVALRPMWQAACEQAQGALRHNVEAMGLEVALAWAACVAAAASGLGGANIAVLLGEMAAAERHAVIEALLQAPQLRSHLHANKAFEGTWRAQHALACLGATMTLPDTALGTYRALCGAHKGAFDAQPEVVLWLTCLSCACEEASAPMLLRLLEIGASQLETLEKDHPQLRERILERLGDVNCESPLVNAFTDTSTRALVAAGPGRSVAPSRLAQACIKHLREALGALQPARRAQRMFAGLSQGHAAHLREAICEDSETLLWPLYSASLESRHVLRCGLPLIDDAVAPLNDARHMYEQLHTTGLPALAVANATHLALVMHKGAAALWSSCLMRLDDDALILAVTGLGTSVEAGASLLGRGPWLLPESLQRSAELAPLLWRIIQSEDGSEGKLTELMPHDTGRVVRLLVESPSLLRRAIDRLGQQPTRMLEGVLEDDDDDALEFESVGDFLEEALRRATALTDALVDMPELLNGQHLTDITAKLTDGLCWSDLPETDVRRTAQMCQWLGSLKLGSETPRVVALRRRDAVDHARRHRPVYDALAFAAPAHERTPLHKAGDLLAVAPKLCHDLGHVHSFGMMPLPRQPSEALTFGARSLEAPQNLHSLQQLQAVAFERDQITYPARWSKCVQAVLADVVDEIARWGRREQATAQQLQPIVLASLSQYISGFTSLSDATCWTFCERALPWTYLLPHLPERPEDPAMGRALQLVADFAVLLRLT